MDMKQCLRLNILDYVNTLAGLGTFWFLMPSCCFWLDVTKHNLSPKPQKRNKRVLENSHQLRGRIFWILARLETKRFLRLNSNAPVAAVKMCPEGVLGVNNVNFLDLI